MCSKFREKNGTDVSRDCVLTKVEKNENSNQTFKLSCEKKTVTGKCKKLLEKISKKRQKWKSDSCDSLVTNKNEQNITFVIGSITETPQNVEKNTKKLLKKNGNRIKNQLKKNSVDFNNMGEREFFCEKCNYSTTRKANWLRHITTKKHYRNLGLLCQLCGRKYATKNGLWKHQQKPCKKYKNTKNPEENTEEKPNEIHNENLEENVETNNSSMLAKMVAEALAPAITKLAEAQKVQREKVEKKYDELINQIIPKIGNNYITNNTVNNTVNNKISIKLFLNEHCKDAINLQDFIKNIQLTPIHLQRAVMNGGIETISDVLIEKLTDMKPNERPIHCSDARRSHFYVKEKGEWARDNNTRKLDKAITSMQAKQFENLHTWIQQHPNWIQSTKLSNEYNEMTQQIAWTAEESRKAKRKIKRALMEPTDLKEAMHKTSIDVKET
jgi:hypothetical protein